MANIHRDYSVGAMDRIGAIISGRAANVPGLGVTKLQIALMDEGLLQEDEIDGWFGAGTQKAIDAYFARQEQTEADAENEGMRGATVTAKVILKGVPHISQWDYPDLIILPPRQVEEINPDGTPKLDDEGNAILKMLPAETCQDYGCMSCCVELLRARDTGDTPNIEWLIPALKEIGGYNAKGQIVWAKVKQLTGFEHTANIGIEQGIAEIDASRPVILEIRTKRGTTHYILGIGHDTGGFHCHDVGSWRGNAYNPPNRTDTPGQTFVKFSDVTRVDSMVKV